MNDLVPPAFSVAVGIFTSSIGPSEAFANQLAAITNMDDGKRQLLYVELSIESMAFGYTYIGNRMKYEDKDKDAVKKAILDEIFPRFAMRDEQLATAGKDMFKQRVLVYEKSHNLLATFEESILQIFQDAGTAIKPALAEKYLKSVADGLDEIKLES